MWKWLGLLMMGVSYACESCVPYGSFETKEFTAIPSFGLYTHYHPDWLITTTDISIIFSVKGRNDARIFLTPKRDDLVIDGIEVILGATSNNDIHIYDAHEEGGLGTYISPLFHGQILSETEYRTFWINWKNGELSLGFGKDLYRNMIMSYRNDALTAPNWTMPTIKKPYNLRYLSFSSWDVPVHYKDIKIGRGYVPRVTRDTKVFSTSSEYDQFNQPNLIYLDSTSFDLILEAQGLSDANIGFLIKRQWNTEDVHAIEVVLDDTVERRHTYARSLIRSGTGQGGVIFAENNQTFLSPVEFRPFWFRLRNRQMTVGKGIVPGENIILYTDEPLPLFPVKKIVVAFSGYFFSTSIRVLSYSDPMHHWSTDLSKWKHDKSIVIPITMNTGTDRAYVPFVAPKEKQECYGMCEAERPYSISLNVPARFQWWHNGAFCAELAIQQSVFSFGVYLSQAVIRKHARYSGTPSFFGDPILGYEIVPDNIEGALHQLGFLVEKYSNKKTLATYPHFFKWLKSHIVKEHPIVWYVQPAISTYVNHAESVVGYFSDHPLSDPNVYPNDLIQHYSGNDLLSYFRRVDSWVEPNCTKGVSGGSECIPEKNPYGYAILGHRVLHSSVRTSIKISDGGQEPVPPHIIPTKAIVTAHDLKRGQSYIMYRYHDFNGKRLHSTHWFRAISDEHVWKDPISFLSSQSVYYVTKIKL